MTDTTETQQFAKYTSNRVFDGIRNMAPEQQKKHIAQMVIALSEQSIEMRKQIQQKDGIIAQMKSDLEGMRCARDEWKRKAEAFEAQAKGKIKQEWLRRVAEGEEGEVE